MTGNLRREPVSYQPFHTEPVLQEGLLAVPRFGGEAEARLAGRFAELGAQFSADVARERALAEQQDRLRRAEAGATAGRAQAPGNASLGDATATTPQLAGPLPKGAEERMRVVVDRLSAKGWSPHQAAAVAGAFVQESAIDPEAVGDNGTAFGIGQWRGERADALKRFAATRGADWKDLGTQIDFWDYEIRSSPSERRALQALRGARDVDAAAAAMMHYERPRNYTPDNPTAGHGWGNRLAEARRAAALTGVLSPTVARGKAGGFRPTGDPVYDEAAGREYAGRLSLVLDQDIDAAFSRFGDDPAALETAFGAIYKAHQGDVYDAIRTDFDAAFYRRTSAYLEKARASALRRQDEAGRAAAVERTTAIEEQKERRLAALDPSSPAAADEINRLQTQADGAYDALVSAGVMAPDDAARAKARSRQGAASGFYERQAEALATPEDVAALKARMRDDFSAGRLAGIDGDGWRDLDGKLSAIETRKRTEGERAANALSARGAGLADRIAKGFDPPQAEVAAYLADAGRTPGGAAIAKTAMARMDVARTIRDRPLPEAEAAVKALKARLGPALGAEDVAVVEFAEGALRRRRELQASDPIGAAAERRVVEEPPALDFASLSGDTAAAAMADRRVTARAAATALGVEPVFLRAGEAQGLKTLTSEDPERAADVLGGLVTGAGPEGPRLLTELGRVSPALQQAGAILVTGGDGDAARDVLFGAGKNPAGRPWQPVPAETRRAAAADVLGAAFLAHPRDGARIEETAATIARYRMVREGVEPSDPEAGRIYRRALQEAAGARFEGDTQWGGIATVDKAGWWSGAYRVVVPPTIRADRFGAVIDALADEDLARLDHPPVTADGRAFTAADLRAATPIATTGGYAFALGDPDGDDPQIIPAKGGKPFVLDVEALADRLAPRVPGAFRGR